MDRQGNLFIQTPFGIHTAHDAAPVGAGGEPTTIAERFAAWLERTPEAFDEFVRIARQLKARGFERYSADGVFHILRWERLVSGVDAEGWKMNNVFASRMSRKVMDDCPDLAGFFETRQLKAE